MPVYTIETPSGRRLKIEAADEATAMRGAQEFEAGQAPPQAAPKGQGHNVPEYVPPGVEGYDPKTGMVQRNSAPYSAMQGVADMGSLGLADEAAAGIGYGLDNLLPGGQSRPYNQILDEIRRKQESAYQDNPKSYIGGQVAGGLAGGAALARSGLSLGANAATRGAGLGRVAAGSMADGAILGGIQGAASGEGLEGRAKGAVIGGAAGGVLGGAAPYAVAGVQAAAAPLISPIMARLRPERYANQAMGEGIRRSGMTPDQIAGIMSRAGADGQDMFNVADAMGHSGQRMLSTVARTPNNMRQTVVDTLHQRQMGQGERLSNALAEGFDAADTAAQRTARLTTARGAAADASYGAARQAAGPVDVSAALQVIDDTLQPGVNRIVNPGNNIADDTVEGALSRVRRMLSDGRSNLSDFSAVLRAKQDVDDMIGAAVRAGRNNQARLLGQVRTELDNVLSGASQPYAAARDAFREQSRVIDAVDTGTAAASGRTRAPDNIQTFNQMNPQQQAAFRAGYADPLIARVESAAASPTTNKARMLMTGKSGQEFPAFAAPGRGTQMGNRIAREQRMFETANTALGGSRTADNLADAAEMSKFDPSVMMNLLRGRPVQAVIDAVTRMANEARGMPPSVMDRIARTLLETNPQAARAMLRQAGARSAQRDGRRALANAILVNMQSAASGRLAAGR